jgi:hypothetical protein
MRGVVDSNRRFKGFVQGVQQVAAKEGRVTMMVMSFVGDTVPAPMFQLLASLFPAGRVPRYPLPILIFPSRLRRPRPHDVEHVPPPSAWVESRDV